MYRACISINICLYMKCSPGRLALYIFFRHDQSFTLLFTEQMGTWMSDGFRMIPPQGITDRRRAENDG